MEFRWDIWPASDFITLFDEFCCNDMRVRLGGNSITVTIPDAPDAEAKARALAERYLQELCAKVPMFGRLTTLDEIPQMPLGVRTAMDTNFPRRPTERTRLAEAIRVARSSLVAQE